MKSRRFYVLLILSRSIVKHLSLSCDPFNYEEFEQDCIAMFCQGTGYKKKLAFCRVGREETWTTLIGASLSNPQTVCPLKSSGMKLFYTMYCDMSGYGIDAWEIPKPSRIPARLANFMYGNSWQLHEQFNFETSEHNLRNQRIPKAYLVVDESSGDIMLVTRHTARHVAEDGTIFYLDPSHDKQLETKYDNNGFLIPVDPYQANPQPLPYKTVRFDVYKVDMRKQKLEHVQSLGNRAIFLGLNQSFTLSTCEFAGLRQNSIYFTNDCTEEIWSNRSAHGGHDLGIYNLEDNSIEPCYPFSDDLKKDMKIKPPLLWVAPNCYC